MHLFNIFKTLHNHYKYDTKSILQIQIHCFRPISFRTLYKGLFSKDRTLLSILKNNHNMKPLTR